MSKPYQTKVYTLLSMMILASFLITSCVSSIGTCTKTQERVPLAIVSAKSSGYHNTNIFSLMIDLEKGLIEPRDQNTQRNGRLWIEITFNQDITRQQPRIKITNYPAEDILISLRNSNTLSLQFTQDVPKGTHQVLCYNETSTLVGLFTILYLNGDITHDRTVAHNDITWIKNNWCQVLNLKGFRFTDQVDLIRCDINRNGAIGGLDIARIRNSANWQTQVDLPGDLDHDNDIDEDDYELFQQTFGLSNLLIGDLDHDYDLDHDDLTIVLQLQGTTINDPLYNPEADLDHNEIINSYDRLLWFQYQQNPTLMYPDFNPEADYDEDGIITFVDYQIWLAYYRLYNII